MKYLFNEKELLDLFIDANNDLRPMYAKPYLKDGYVHAVNGYRLIRIKAESLNGEYEPTDKMNLPIPNDNCDYLITDKDIEKALASVPHEEEVIKIGEDVECSECAGSGKVDWEYTDNNGKMYEYEYDCPVCDGTGYAEEAQEKKTGNMIPCWTASIGFGNRCIRVDHVQTLLEAMKIIGVTEVHLVAQGNNMSVFKIDENTQVIIADYMRDADYVVTKGGRNEQTTE